MLDLTKLKWKDAESLGQTRIGKNYDGNFRMLFNNIFGNDMPVYVRQPDIKNNTVKISSL